MPPALGPEVDCLIVCGERFRPDRDLALLWRYRCDRVSHARAVVETPRGDVLEILERVSRKLPGGYGAYRSIRRDALRLERPAALLCELGPHIVGLALPLRCVSEPAPDTGPAMPIVIGLGDRETYFAFHDTDYAREWARMVRAASPGVPAWEAFAAERWVLRAAHVLPKIGDASSPHGLTELEDILDQVLISDQRERLRRAASPARARRPVRPSR